LIGLIVWELHQIKLKRKPILDLMLFKNRNFAVSFVMMFFLGFALYATTVLIPQMVQSLMGYTAEQAGLVLSPGGCVIIVLMPLVGFLVGHTDSRYLVALGFIVTAAALVMMHSLNLGASYGYLASLRMFQASGLAFLFVPINTLSYNNIPRNKNNDVSGLTNLARNVGGSVGTSMVVTLLARRMQAHQAVMTRNFTMSNPAFRDTVTKLGDYLRMGMGGPAGPMGPAGMAAQADLYMQLQRQSAMLAYLDIIIVLATASALMVPLVFLMQKPQAGAAPAAH
jgi:DHA2 family multidrug resistance protein